MSCKRPHPAMAVSNSSHQVSARILQAHHLPKSHSLQQQQQQQRILVILWSLFCLLFILIATPHSITCTSSQFMVSASSSSPLSETHPNLLPHDINSRLPIPQRARYPFYWEYRSDYVRVCMAQEWQMHCTKETSSEQSQLSTHSFREQLFRNCCENGAYFASSDHLHHICSIASEPFSNHSTQQNYPASQLLPQYPRDPHLQQEYFLKSMASVWVDSYFLKQRERHWIDTWNKNRQQKTHELHEPASLFSSRNTPRRNYLIIASHMWDPVLSSLSDQIAHIIHKYRRYWNALDFADVLYYSWRGFKLSSVGQNGRAPYQGVMNSIGDSPVFATPTSQTIIQNMVEIIGSQLPSEIQNGSGQIYWMRNGKVIAQWDKSQELEHFVTLGLFGADSLQERNLPPSKQVPSWKQRNLIISTPSHREENMDAVPQIYGQQFVENEKIPSATLTHHFSHFDESVWKLFGWNLQYRNNVTTTDNNDMPHPPLIYRQHEKTIYNIILPRYSSESASDFASSHSSVLQVFFQRGALKMSSDTEILIYRSHTNQNIRIEKLIIEFEFPHRSHPTTKHFSQPEETAQIDLSSVPLTRYHSVSTQHFIKPQSQIFSEWLLEVTQFWIQAFNPEQLQSLLRNSDGQNKKLVVFFLDENDSHQWNTLQRRIISFIVSVHRHHTYLRRNLKFAYAKKSTFSNYFERLNYLHVEKQDPSVVFLDPQIKDDANQGRMGLTARHRQCAPNSCLHYEEGQWVVNYDSLVAFLYKQMADNGESWNADNGRAYFLSTQTFSHSPASKPYANSPSETVLNLRLLQHHHSEAKKVPTLLFFYTPLCAHCLKIFHDISKMRREHPQLQIHAYDYYHSNISSHHTFHLNIASNKRSSLHQEAVHSTQLKDLIRGFPSVLSMGKDGRTVDKYSGTIYGLSQWIQDYCTEYEGSKPRPIIDMSSPHDEL